ncbi:MAG: hypothetical protein GY772_19415, partial [bacterium]|nr:hypothetical protein [bacterium]
MRAWGSGGRGHVEMGGLAVEEALRAEGGSGGRGHVDMGALAVKVGKGLVVEEAWRAWGLGGRGHVDIGGSGGRGRVETGLAVEEACRGPGVQAGLAVEEVSRAEGGLAIEDMLAVEERARWRGKRGGRGAWAGEDSQKGGGGGGEGGGGGGGGA